MPSNVTFTSVMPSIPVAALAPAISFYVKTLGFSLVFQNGDAFAIVARNGVELGLLSAVAHDVTPGSGKCYVKVEGIDHLYTIYCNRGVTVRHKLKVETYGMKEFQIADPDGNEINFGQPEL